MDDLELEALLSDIESDRVERKASIADRERICEAICALARKELQKNSNPPLEFRADDTSILAIIRSRP